MVGLDGMAAQGIAPTANARSARLGDLTQAIDEV